MNTHDEYPGDRQNDGDALSWLPYDVRKLFEVMADAYLSTSSPDGDTVSVTQLEQAAVDRMIEEDAARRRGDSEYVGTEEENLPRGMWLLLACMKHEYQGANDNDTPLSSTARNQAYDELVARNDGELRRLNEWWEQIRELRDARRANPDWQQVMPSDEAPGLN